MNDGENIERVLQVVRGHVPRGVKPESITVETPLMGERSPFDSIQLLDLMLVLESKFAIRIREQDVTNDTFRNIGSLAETIAAIKERGR